MRLSRPPLSYINTLNATSADKCAVIREITSAGTDRGTSSVAEDSAHTDNRQIAPVKLIASGLYGNVAASLRG